MFLASFLLYQPNENTRRLVVEEGGFKYDSDSYADDLPYWTLDFGNKRPHLIIPYTLSENDMKFTSSSMSTGREFSEYLKDTLRYAMCRVHKRQRIESFFDLHVSNRFLRFIHSRYLVEEGRAGSPKMMNIGLHCRLARPGRVHGLAEFLDYAKSFSRRDVWLCTREQVADYWYENHFPFGASQTLEKGPATDDAEADGEGKSEEAESKAEAAVNEEEEGDII